MAQLARAGFSVSLITLVPLLLGWLSGRENFMDPGALQVPAIAFCEERKHLLEEFLRAIHDVVTLNRQQTQAVIGGDEDFPRFDLLIGMATQKKNAAKYALLKHIDDHGC
jgi:hypothetical protein